MENKKIKIVTHNGVFHSDDVFGVATLYILLGEENVEVIRTRDEEIIENGDYVLDVGGISDSENNRFDHHQREGAGERGNSIPYASFGLIWKKFGEEICKSKEIANNIDKKLVQYVDALDNGLNISKPIFDDVLEYTVGSVIGLYKPTWKEKNKKMDEEFNKAVKLAIQIIKREIEVAKHCLEAEEIVEKQYKLSEDKRIIIFDSKDQNFGREVITNKLIEYKEPLFAVFYRTDVKNWQTVAIRKQKNTYESRKPFPSAWRGLKDEEFSNISGVPDSIFCHKTGFMCIAKTKEAAIKLAKLAIDIPTSDVGNSYK